MTLRARSANYITNNIAIYYLLCGCTVVIRIYIVQLLGALNLHKICMNVFVSVLTYYRMLGMDSLPVRSGKSNAEMKKKGKITGLTHLKSIKKQ